MNRLFLLIILSFFIYSCDVSFHAGYADEDKEIIESKISEFHNLYNDEDYDQIIANAHPAFKERHNANELNQAMARTKGNYGKFVSVTEKWINIITEPPIQARAVYNSKFENKDTTEMFVFMRSVDGYGIVSYQIFEGTRKPS